jgi:hypothetical protein
VTYKVFDADDAADDELEQSPLSFSDSIITSSMAIFDSILIEFNMQRHSIATNQNKKSQSFVICSFVILWILTSLCIVSVYDDDGIIEPELAAVQCQYGPIYASQERYQFPFVSALGYSCCESKHDSLYDKTMTQELIVIKRDVICERGLKVSYKVDFIFPSEPEEKMNGMIENLQRQFPLNESITYWYYPKNHRLRKENYLIDYPLMKDKFIIVVAFIFMSTGFIFAIFYGFCILRPFKEKMEPRRDIYNIIDNLLVS